MIEIDVRLRKLVNIIPQRAFDGFMNALYEWCCGCGEAGGLFTAEVEEDGGSPSHRPPPDTLPRKTLLAEPLRSDGLKYALATDQSCLGSDKPPLSGPAMRGK